LLLDKGGSKLQPRLADTGIGQEEE